MMQNQTILNTPTSATSEQELLCLLIEAYVLDTTYTRNKDYKKRITDRFTQGEKREGSNAQGLNLGSVSMSTPNNKAVCNDDAVLLVTSHDKGMELIDHLPAPGTPEAVKRHSMKTPMALSPWG